MAAMTEETFAKSKCYKINRKYFLPIGCPSWLQFKLLIDLIFEPVHSERRRSLPLSLLAKPVGLIIRKRSNNIMPFPLSRWKLHMVPSILSMYFRLICATAQEL